MRRDAPGTMKKIIQDKQAANEILLRPQYEFVTDEQENPVVNYVCKFETLQKDFDFVCKRLRFPQTRLPAVNVTNRAASENVYDRELKEMVEKFYRKDFDFFGYPTDFQTASQA